MLYEFIQHLEVTWKTSITNPPPQKKDLPLTKLLHSSYISCSVFQPLPLISCTSLFCIPVPMLNLEKKQDIYWISLFSSLCQKHFDKLAWTAFFFSIFDSANFTIPNQFWLDWSLIRASGSWHRLVTV
jgi:hypothetical protein